MSTYIPQLTPLEAQERRETVVLLDVREPDEVAELRIPGSRHIPLGDLPQRFTELDQRTPVVAACRSGRRSQRAAEFLQQQGFEVANLSGGITRWMQEQQPVLAGR